MSEIRQWTEKFSEQEQTNRDVNEGTCGIQFWEMLQVARPQIHQIEDKNGFIDSKIPVSILS